MSKEEMSEVKKLQKELESPEVKRAKDALEMSKSINLIQRFKGLSELAKIKQEVAEKEEIKKQRQEDSKAIVSVIKRMLKKIDCEDVDGENRIRALVNFLSGEIEKEFDPAVLIDVTKFINYITTTECPKIDTEKLTKEYKNFVKSSSETRKEYLRDNKPKRTTIDIRSSTLSRQSTVKNSALFAE